MKKTAKVLALLFALATILSSCRSAETAEYYDSDFFVMDSTVKIRLSTDKKSDGELADLSSSANEIAVVIEKSISRTDADSSLSKLNTSDTGSDIDINLASVLETALKIADITDGAYDPTIGTLTELWNITGGGPVPEQKDIDNALSHIGYENITASDTVAVKHDSGTVIDLGGIGKGYAIQKMCEHLADSGVKYGLCSFGSSVGVFGEKKDAEKFKIAICDPASPQENLANLFIGSGFIASSGDYERYFEVDGKRYHHIFDPKTGYPADSGLRGVTVWAQNGQIADALSTALFVMGADRALELYASGELQFEAVLITDSEIYLTDGLKADGVFELLNENYNINYGE